MGWRDRLKAKNTEGNPCQTPSTPTNETRVPGGPAEILAQGIADFMPDIVGDGGAMGAILAPALNGALSKMTDDAAIAIAETMGRISTQVFAASVAVAGAGSQD